MELLVVIIIIALVTIAAIGGGALSAYNHREVSEAARLLQGALVGARDKAIHDGQPCGIRLLPDPNLITFTPAGTVDQYAILAYNRVIPIDSPPEYSEGMVSVFPSATYADVVKTVNGYTGCPCLVLEQAVTDSRTNFPNAPTSWFWNVRVGDKIQLNNAGPWYTVVGPMAIGPNATGTTGNPEMFVNIGMPGTALPQLNGPHPCEFLLLVNGLDDNGNGWIDEGFDGINNNAIVNNNTLTDEHTATLDEWETESWTGAAANGMVDVPYTIRRRPLPGVNAREIALPSSMVIDATGVFLSTQERSRLPVNSLTGYADIILNPDGTLVPTTVYSSPASFNMGGTFFHFWLADRSDLAPVQTTGTYPNQSQVSLGLTAAQTFYLPIPVPNVNPNGPITSYSGPTLKGGYSLLTLFTRTGQIVATDTPAIDDPVAAADASPPRPFNVNLPFLAPQQGDR